MQTHTASNYQAALPKFLSVDLLSNQLSLLMTWLDALRADNGRASDVLTAELLAMYARRLSSAG